MRRASNQLLGNETMRKMAPYQRAEAAQLLWEFANQPDVLQFLCDIHYDDILCARLGFTTSGGLRLPSYLPLYMASEDQHCKIPMLKVLWKYILNF